MWFMPKTNKNEVNILKPVYLDEFSLKLAMISVASIFLVPFDQPSDREANPSLES